MSPSRAVFDEEVDAATARAFADARAVAAEDQDRGIEAWREIAKQAPSLRTPRRELAQLYEATGQYNALVQVLRDEAEIVHDPEEKVGLLRQMADVYRDRLNLDVMLVNVLAQILNLVPGHVAVMDELAAQYEKMNRWTDLIAVLKKKAEAASDAETRVAVWSRVASLFLERFSNQAEAIKSYEQVIKLDPRNRDALANLEAMYEKRRDWKKLLELCQRGDVQAPEVRDKISRYEEALKRQEKRQESQRTAYLVVAIIVLATLAFLMFALRR